MSASMFTCTVRKISTGYKITAFQGDSLDHLRVISMVLARSPEYGRCYVVCTDWQGNVLFNIQPQASPALHASLPAQAPSRPPYAVSPALPSYNQYVQREQVLRVHAALPEYRRPPMPASHTRVLDAEFEDAPVLSAAKY